MPLVVWTLLAIGCLLTFRFMWLLLVLVALALNAINVIGCKLPPFQHAHGTHRQTKSVLLPD